MIKNNDKYISGIHSLEKSIEWAIDKDQPVTEERAFQTIISDRSDTPFILVVQKVLSKVHNISKRLQIAYGIEGKMPKYWKSRYVEEGDMQSMAREFRSYIMYLRILDIIVDEQESIKNKYESCAGDLTLDLDTRLYHLYIGITNNFLEFFTYSQALYYYKHLQNEMQLNPTTLPVYVDLFKDRVTAKSITDFCESLLDAEYVRRQVVEYKPNEQVTVANFPIRTRNNCFVKYIFIRAEEERKILLKNNERLEEPNSYKAKIELLKKAVNEVTDAQNDKGDSEVIKMAIYFIRFLRKDLGWNDPDEESIDPSDEEFNISSRFNEINKRIKAVSKKGVCKYKADWGVIMRLLVELDEYSNTDYLAVAERINKACGKEVTTDSALKQSHAMLDISGKWKTGWKDEVHTRQSANLLNRYNEIANIFMK